MNFFIKGLLNIFTYHPEQDDLKNEQIKHFIKEFVILIENLAIWTFLFSSLNSDHLVILAVTWTFYWVSFLLKVIFYLVMHPSSAQIYDQVESKQHLIILNLAN